MGQKWHQGAKKTIKPVAGNSDMCSLLLTDSIVALFCVQTRWILRFLQEIQYCLW